LFVSAGAVGKKKENTKVFSPGKINETGIQLALHLFQISSNHLFQSYAKF